MTMIHSSLETLTPKTFLYLVLVAFFLIAIPAAYAGQGSTRDFQMNPQEEFSQSEQKNKSLKKRLKKKLRKTLARKNGGDNSAVGAFLLGILNVLLILIAAFSSVNIYFWLFALCFGIIPIWLGVFSLRRMKAAGKGKGKTVAILGIILGGLSLSILGFFIIRILFFFPS